MIPYVFSPLLLAYALAAHGASESARDMASRFAAALQSHDVAALRSLGVTERSAFSFPLRDTLDRYPCITIDSWTVEAVDGDPAVTRIRLAGSGVAVNARHDWRPIPDAWIVKVAATPPGPRIDFLTTEDHYIAQHIIAAADDAARQEIIAAHPEFSAHNLLLAVLDELEETLPPEEVALSDSLAFVIGASEKGEYRDVEARAIVELPDSVRKLHAAQVALAIAERTNDCDVIASALFRNGNAVFGTGAFEEASEILSRAAAMAGTLDDGRIALKALHNVAHAELWKGDLRRALLATESVQAQARQFGWREGEIVARLTMADIDWTIGDDEGAAGLRRRGMAELDAIGNRDWSIWISTELAETEMRLGHRDQALRLMRSALGRAPSDFRNRDVIVEGLARMYIECGRTDDAQRLLRPEARPNRLVYAELAAAKHRYEEAIRFARQVAVCSGDDDACWQAPLIAGRALEHLGRRDQAIAKLEESIQEIERRRSLIDANEMGRARFFELRLEPYRDLLDLYVRAGRARDALRIAETVKARSLLDTLSLGRPDLRSALTPAEEERHRQLDGRIDHLNRALLNEPAGPGRAALDRERGAARKELEEFDAEMSLRHPLGRGLRSSELSQKLDAIVPSADVAAIEYAVLPRSVLAFVVTRAIDGAVSVHAKRIDIAAPAIARRVAALRRAIAARSLASEGQLAQLYDLVVAPLRPWTSGRKLLFIVPDGPLWQVPFQALGSRSGLPMIAETAVAYAPSFAALTAVHTHPRVERRTLLAMGDAAIGSEATARLRSFNRDAVLGNLPDAANEVRSIAAEYGPGQSDVYLHGAATETMLKASAGHHRIIHLATHGVADSHWPMFSALVLAPTAQDDGLLEAREVADMRLDADLVVLSACNTAGGLIRSGEGVIGLSWAFLLAGCPTTVVSQWSAESRATSQLMIEFHRHLVRGVPVPEALRQAQLSVMRDNRYRHPFYWAAFVVIGRP